jgi:hypothetical protein
MHTHTHAHTHTHTHTHTHAHTHTRTHMHMHTHARTHTRVHTHRRVATSRQHTFSGVVAQETPDATTDGMLKSYLRFPQGTLQTGSATAIQQEGSHG